MNELLKRLLEERGRHIAELRAVVDLAEGEKRELSAEETQTYTRANGEIDKIDLRITEVRAVAEREAKHDEARASLESLVRPSDPQPAAKSDVSRDVRAFLRGDAGRSFELRAAGPGAFQEARVLSSLTAGAGGNTVETAFYNRLVAHMIEVSGVLMASPTVLNTDGGENIQIPKTTAHTTAAIVAQAGTIATSEPTFGQVTLGAYKYGALMQVARELIDDTSVDLEGYLAMQAGRAVGNTFGAHAVTGTGTAQPTGVVTAASVGVTGGTAVAGAFTSDNLIDLYFSVIAPYRNSPSCAWLMKDASLATVRKFKGSDGQYIWQPSYQIGQPDTILGKPVYTDPFVPAVAVNARSVAFGDMSQYFVRMVNGIRFERSDDFAFNTDLVTYRCLLRADGTLVDLTGAVKCFVGAAT